MHYIQAILLVAGLLAASAAWAGFALSVLWGWFIVPLFALPALSVPAAIGLMMVASCLRGRDFEKQDEKGSEVLARIILVPALSLMLGWVVQLFI